MKHFFLLLLISLTIPTRAQFLRADHKKAEELKHRPLAVVLFDPETQASNSCDSLHMVWYNDHITGIFAKYWTLSDSVIYLDSRKAASIMDSKSHEYILFSAGPSREGQQSSGDVFWYPSFTFLLFLSEDGNRMDDNFVDRGVYSEQLVPDMEMSGQLHRGKYIFKLSLAGMMMAESDIVFVLRQFDKNIRAAMAEKKAKGGIYAPKIPKNLSTKLKNDTLLIPESFAPENLNEETITSYYKHPFKISSDRQIEDAMDRASNRKAFIHYLWSDHERMFMGFVAETESMDIIGAFKPGQLKVENIDCLPAGTSYRTLIRGKVRALRSLR